MRRRDVFIVGALAAARAMPAPAQEGRAPATIGFLGLGSRAVTERRLASLRQGLDDLGRRDGRDYVFEVRSAGADAAYLRQAASDLASLAPDVLVTHAGGTAVLKSVTQTIPIVMVSGDAVTTGLVASLSRPGGNVTGVSFLSPELVAKRLELLKEMIPDLEMAGLLALADYPVTTNIIDAVQATARALEMRIHVALVRKPEDLAGAFSDLNERKIRGIVVQDEPMLIANATRIAEASSASGMLCVGFLELARQGGHLAYSIDFDEVWRRAGRMVSAVLGGARPQDLPVEQPTRFELVLNSPALTHLGLSAPLSILTRADEVIE